MLAEISQNVLAVRLNVGQPIHESLLELCTMHNIAGGYVLSGIGMLKDPELAYFVGDGKYASKVFEGKHELLNLSGNIARHGDGLMAHLHVTLCDEEYNSFGGHLVAATVGLTVETAILAVNPPVNMHRKMEPEWGLPGLYIETGTVEE